MIQLKDIQTALTAVLKQHGFTVTAGEIKEGFLKPTCFVEVLPVSVTLQNKYTELVTVSAEIAYHPEVETKEALLSVTEAFKTMFLYTPIPVLDRFISTEELLFDYDKSVLYASFEISYLNEILTQEEPYPKMEYLHERLVTEGHGTSQDTH